MDDPAPLVMVQTALPHTGSHADNTFLVSRMYD